MFTAKQAVCERCGYEIVTLAGAGHEVKLLPVNGFNLFSWRYQGQDIMMEIADMSAFGTKYGTPILFPMPNRVKDAEYTWQGQTYTVQKRGQKIARHGLVCDEPFTVTAIGADETGATCTAEIAILPGNDLYEGYPFACRLRVTYTLTAAGVRMDAQVDNLGDALMPFGFALHPYFTKRGDGNACFLKVPVKRYYETDENLIPTGRILPAGEGTTIDDDFHSVESLYLDTVFRGLTQDLHAQVKYADMLLTIRASDCFRNAVVFTPHNKPGFCIEPQTCATNALNLHAQGLVDESGLIVLPAGRRFDCMVEFSVETL